MTSIWERVSTGSAKLTADAAKSAPKTVSDKTTNHVWCSAFIEGADKCKCIKHGGKPIEQQPEQ